MLNQNITHPNLIFTFYTLFYTHLEFLRFIDKELIPSGNDRILRLRNQVHVVEFVKICTYIQGFLSHDPENLNLLKQYQTVMLYLQHPSTIHYLFNLELLYVAVCTNL